MLDPKVISAIDAEREKLPAGANLSVDALRIAQKHYRWISDDTLSDLACFLGLTVEELDGVATFYNRIYRKPVGRNVILVCDSVCCAIKDCDLIKAKLKEKLGVEAGQTTSDGRFTLLMTQCLGLCEQAPALMIEDVAFGNVDASRLDIILGNFT